MGGKSVNRSRKRKFHGNRFTDSTKDVPETTDIFTASGSKLKNSNKSLTPDILDNKNVTGFRIIDIELLMQIFAVLCCPSCLSNKLTLVEDSRFGLCSNFSLHCNNCTFTTGFATSKKKNKISEVNTRFVYALRIIGKGLTAAKKFCATLNMPCLSNIAFRNHEKKILNATTSVAKISMTTAAKEVKTSKKKSEKVTECGVSVDGTWQRRGYSSLNGVVSVISVATGKILDIEILSQFCRICKKLKIPVTSAQRQKHSCANHSGSSGNMEVVGAYRIFERSETSHGLCYTQYYGDGDSKGFEAVKDIYGKDSVEKLECIGHIQKRVGTHLRKLKTGTKGLGGKGKLTDNFINRLQNYYGIAIRANSGNLIQMQSATIAAFAHCCSSKAKPMHGQCPKGVESWCKYQRASALGKTYTDNSIGLPQNIINIVKPVYMKLCDQKLLSKCLHGKTQNANESFNGVLWTLIPKNVFVEKQTLDLGSFLAVIQYNDGFCGFIKVLEALEIDPGYFTLSGYNTIDNVRIDDAKRKSLPKSKSIRKIARASRKKKSMTSENKEGVMYKSGGF